VVIAAPVITDFTAAQCRQPNLLYVRDTLGEKTAHPQIAVKYEG